MPPILVPALFCGRLVNYFGCCKGFPFLASGCLLHALDTRACEHTHRVQQAVCSACVVSLPTILQRTSHTHTTTTHTFTYTPEHPPAAIACAARLAGSVCVCVCVCAVAYARRQRQRPHTPGMHFLDLVCLHPGARPRQAFPLSGVQGDQQGVSASHRGQER